MIGNSYHRKFGENPRAASLLAMLGLTRDSFGRYRDAYLTDRGTTITAYTRMGGESRPFFQTQHDSLAAHREYLRDWPDDDATYHYYKFLVPDAHLAQAKELFSVQEPMRTVSQKFDDLMRELKHMTTAQMERDPRVADDMAALKSLQRTGGSAILDTTDDDMPLELKPPSTGEY